LTHTSVFSLLNNSGESRELTEPECDREWVRRGRRSRSVGRPEEEGEEEIENISSEQLQQELNTIIANYQQEKARKAQEANSGEQSQRFIISV